MVRETRGWVVAGGGVGVLFIVSEIVVMVVVIVVGCGGGGEGVGVSSVVGEAILCWELRRKGVDRERSKVFLCRSSLRLPTRRENGGERSPHRVSEGEGRRREGRGGEGEC